MAFWLFLGALWVGFSVAFADELPSAVTLANLSLVAVLCTVSLYSTRGGQPDD